MKKILFLMSLMCILFLSPTRAQEVVAKNMPFSMSLGSITVTGIYSDGCLNVKKVNGVSILGLITWGGSSEISCTPGCSYCRIVEASVSFGRMITNADGDNCFENANLPGDVTPVFIGVKDGKFVFAIDIDQTAQDQKGFYSKGSFELKSPFVLEPGIVRKLQLHDRKEEMGYVVPAGSYPLYRDGKIYYWTFDPQTK